MVKTGIQYGNAFKKMIEALQLNQFIELVDEINFNDFSVLMCVEIAANGDENDFDLIAKNGKYYDSNFNDWVKIMIDQIIEAK